MSTTKVTSRRTDWKTAVIEDPETGELFIDLPETMLAQLGWDEGTELVWYEDADGNWNLKKKIIEESE